MDDLEIMYIKKLCMETKKGHEYLQNWSIMSDKKRKENMKENKEFWNNMFDDTKLIEQNK